MRVYRALVIPVVLLAAPYATPQEGPLVQTGHVMTFRELLSKRNVDLSEPSLVEALRNPDAHVRYLSALVLAEDKATNAIPAIASALRAEAVPETKANIALALAQLGNDMGFETLRNVCNDQNVPDHLRVYAAMYLLDVGEGSCLNSTLDLMQSGADSSARVLALSQLHRFPTVSADDSKRIEAVILLALRDQTPQVRIAASGAASRLAPPVAISTLTSAIAVEQDEAVKSRMQLDMQRVLATKSP